MVHKLPEIVGKNLCVCCVFSGKEILSFCQIFKGLWAIKRLAIAIGESPNASVVTAVVH